MTESSDVTLELDRLITVGHQDSSLVTAIYRKFPDLTAVELAAGFAQVTTIRSMKMAVEDR